MSWNNKVVWSEGMFMRPQHFQQQTRHFEHFVEGRCAVLQVHAWGIKELTLDQQALGLGKVSVASARGVFPDGTPFNIPDEDDPPKPLDVPENVQELIVYLCLPCRRVGTAETDGNGALAQLARYSGYEYEVRDSNAGTESLAGVEVGRLKTLLMLENGAREEYACIGVGRITESRSDNTVVLDQRFVPPLLDCQASHFIEGFIRELRVLLNSRGIALADRVSQTGRGGAAELSDYLLLQTINRYEPVVAHLAELTGLHPESFFRLAVEMAGELSTTFERAKRPPEFPSYRHDDLQATFEPVASALRRYLTEAMMENAVSIPLELKKGGVRVGTIKDRTLLTSSDFVLAVSADTPLEEIRKHFPQQVKIGSVDDIRDLVHNALPGITVRDLPIAPREIPYHRNCIYFQLEQTGDRWAAVQSSAVCAIHLAGNFPGVNMEFWAIRRR